VKARSSYVAGRRNETANQPAQQHVALSRSATMEERLASSGPVREEAVPRSGGPGFSAGDIALKFTPVFGYDQARGPFVRLWLYIAPGDVTFAEEAGGWQRAEIAVGAAAVGEKNRVAGNIARGHTIRVRGATYQRILEQGMLFQTDLPVKKAGGYQLRLGVRDMRSKHTGYTSQRALIPEVEKGRLALSGIVLASGKETEANAASAWLPLAYRDREDEALQVINSAEQQNLAARLFHPGAALDYAFIIYHARLDKTSRQPNLSIETTLLRGNQPVLTAKAPYTSGRQVDDSRFIAGGRLQLGPDLAPGAYVLQITVTDELAGEKHRTATQPQSFTIAK
jgi:hypothetical protein